jgi:LmbE family N-acetylglucosaminyl deacetylase
MGTHLFLSPHLDDAILSCGGAIHGLTWSGERVIVVTAMAGEPLAPLPDTPVLRALRATWDAHPLRTRRAEDAQAARTLGAQVYHLPLTECAFRTTVCGAGDSIALYPEHDSPFADVNRADDARVTLFETRLPFENVAAIYAPMGIDPHVDHRLVRDWALVLTGALDAPPLVLYEEFPQARNPALAARAHDYYRRQLPALALQAEITPLNADTVSAKLRAIACYRSHLGVLWRDAAEMERLARDYMSAVGSGTPAERYWRVIR